MLGKIKDLIRLNETFSLRAGRYFLNALGLRDRWFPLDLKVLDFDKPNAKGQRYGIYLDKLDANRRALGSDQNNIYKLLRHSSLLAVVEDLRARNIGGVYAECGVWNGSSAAAINQIIGPEKELYLIDAFDLGGFQEFQEADNEGAGRDHREEAKLQRIYTSNFDLVEEVFEGQSNVKLVKGWIPDVLETLDEQKYAFVHVDVDLEEATLSCYEYFFPRLSKGGAIVCDDYGYSQFPGARSAVDSYINSLDRKEIAISIEFGHGGHLLVKS